MKRAVSVAVAVAATLLSWAVPGAADESTDDPDAAERPPEPHHGLSIGAQSFMGFYRGGTGQSGNGIVGIGTLSYDLTPAARAWARLGAIHSAPPGAPDAWAVSNPSAGASYSIPIVSELSVTPSLVVYGPFGQGGGDTPDKNLATAIGAARLITGDGALFDPNYLSFYGGATLTYRHAWLNAQLGETFQEEIRVKGEAVAKDATKTRLLSRAHLGAFVLPRRFEVYTEALYLRYLADAAVVKQDASAVDLLWLGGGVALDLAEAKLAAAYYRPIDDPMWRQNYDILALSLIAPF